MQTDLLKRAFRVAAELPPQMQDDVARAVLMYAGDEPGSFELTPEDEAAIEMSRDQARRGEFATEDDMRAIWAKHGL